MRLFDANNKCDACDNTGASVEFQGVSVCTIPRVLGGIPADASYILRKCKRCGYTWRELPLYRSGEVVGG